MSQDVAEKIDLVVPKEYRTFLKEIKEKILSSQAKAALAVNRELIALYWDIGTRIHFKQKSGGGSQDNRNGPTLQVFCLRKAQKTLNSLNYNAK